MSKPTFCGDCEMNGEYIVQACGKHATKPSGPPRHGDHDASCLCCGNLEIRGEDWGYSEFTPEPHAVFECKAGAFSECWDDSMKRLCAMPGECGKFEPRNGP